MYTLFIKFIRNIWITLCLFMLSTMFLCYNLVFLFGCSGSQLWHVGSSSLTSTGLWDPCIQFSSVAQSCPTLCHPINRSTPGLPVHHQLPEFTQTHVHRVSDAIQPSQSLSSPSPPAPKTSQHQSLFQ